LLATQDIGVAMFAHNAMLMQNSIEDVASFWGRVRVLSKHYGGIFPPLPLFTAHDLTRFLLK
jgi:hypothetical protein